MKLAVSYVKERLRAVLAALLLGAAAAGLFWLFNLPLAVLAYILLVAGTLWLLFFIIPGFVQYARRVGKLRELQENVTALLPELEPSGPLPEALLLESLNTLCRQSRQKQELHAQRQENMLAYYTLWVHQIKTPIAAMRLILQSQPSPGGEALGQELFKIERYVEMVLGYQRLETISQDLCLEPCALRPIAARAAKKFAPQFIYKKLYLHLEDFELEAVTDEKWMLFVLEQLLSNAVKYTHSGGVEVFAEGAVLVIRDTGIGIAPEDLPRVFQRGFTGRTGRRESASTGLGLHLVKRVLDTLQIPVEVRSVLGKGTQVRLDLRQTPAPRD